MSKSTTQSSELPYPPSWMDRFIGWIDRLPGPTWTFYVVLVLVMVMLANVIGWIDGMIPLGVFDMYLAIESITIIYFLAAYHYLTRVGANSLKAFRPLLDVDDAEVANINYQLGTLPRKLGWLAILLGIGLQIPEILGGGVEYENAQTALPYVLDILIFLPFTVITFFAFVIRSIRQLRLISKLHTRASNINLLDLDPMHAFSALTARAGAVLIFILIIGINLDTLREVPTGPALAYQMLLFGLIALLAIAIFVVPLIGMRNRLEEEKVRALSRLNELLRSANERMHANVRNNQNEGNRDLASGIRTLVSERELLEKTPTWPWDPGTIRGFASTLLLPIFLLLVSQMLNRLF